ncbi:EAL domain-containing protein [Halomonas sp. CH40]
MTSTEASLLKALQAIRKHFDMDVAFISRIENDQRSLELVDKADENFPVNADDSGSSEDSYCQRVIDGRLPELIHDAQQEPEALSIKATQSLPIGAHLSVPIRMQDGSIYGTLCCFDRQPDTTLNSRDLSMMHVFAEFAAHQLEYQEKQRQENKMIKTRIHHVLEQNLLHCVFQPMHDILNQRIAGYEALTRFNATPQRSPDKWFNEAARVGLQETLEITAIQHALEYFHYLPDSTYLSLNASPSTIVSDRLLEVLAPYPLNRLMLEVTEHDVVDDYDNLYEALSNMRAQGLRLAIDDAGAGYASFRHILRLSPEVIKLDQSLTRDIDSRPESQALAAALVGFASKTHSRLIAEGVETQQELDTLKHIGVQKVQGYLLGKPGPLPHSGA